MPASHKESYTINASVGQLCSLLKNPAFLKALNIEFKSKNLSPNGVWFRFHHGVTFTSWGEKITVTLTPLSPDSTKTEIESVCDMPTQVMDWGKNKVNVLNIYEYILKNFNAYNVAANNQQSIHIAAPANNSTPQISQNDTVFCYSYGAKIKATHAFCGKCGAKQ